MRSKAARLWVAPAPAWSVALANLTLLAIAIAYQLV